MDRRDFLRQGLGAGSGILLSAGLSAAQVSAVPRKVIVIGAGLAGLVAAYELNKLNYDVTVLEAQARSGGRVFTFRGFDEGLYGEAGAARIPSDHDLTHKYAAEFGLELIPFYPSDRQFMRLRNGRPEKVGWKRYTDSLSMLISLGRQEHWKKISGGNDLLPKGFATRLGDKIRFEAPVVKIEQDKNGVNVLFNEKGRLETTRGDAVLAAIPFTMLSKIDVSPAFSRQKADVIRTTKYDSASRVLLETTSRFWHDMNLNGFATGENFAEIWESSFGLPGMHGILQNYVRYDTSLALTKQAPDDRLTGTIRSLGKFFPDLNKNYVRGYSKCWSEDPWAAGAWGLLGGDRLEIGKMPEGRIFFAGEHLSGHASWMQGALQSGLSAVDEIKKSNNVRASL